MRFLQKQINAQREKMRLNRYYIKIKFSKRNSFIGQIDNVPYKNSRVYGDSFIFRAKEISIIAERSSIYDGNAILTNTSNSIFQQTLKALLYCYAVNLSSLQLTSIKISRRTVRKEEEVVTLQYDKKTQPLQGNITTPIIFNEGDLAILLQEDDKAEKFRNILSHWLKGMTSIDRYYKFERLWRTFEQLSFYSNRASVKNKELDALRNMRNFFIANPNYFIHTKNLISTMTYDELRKFQWRKLILNNYPKGGTQNAYKGYQDYFVLANTDYRIMNLLDETLVLRQNELNHYGFIANIQNHITFYKQHPQNDDMQLVALLCCKYSYFLRNKMFHGEIVDKTFSFMPNNNDDILIDKLNELLGIVTSELINSFKNL